MNWTQKDIDAHHQRHGLALVPVAAPLVTEAERTTAARVEVKAERDLQARIYAYLTQHREKGTVHGVINPPMHKRTQLPTGWPDFSFVYRGKAVALEAKIPGKKAEPHQVKCHEEMRTDGWLVMVVNSVDDAAAVLDAVDYAVETGR